MSAAERISTLHAERPKSLFVRLSLAAMFALFAYSWLTGGFGVADFFSKRRLDNVRRFLHDARPYPLQDRPFDLGVFWDWTVTMMSADGGQGWIATRITLAMSIAAIVIAGVGGIVLCFPAARTFATPEPYLPGSGPVSPARRNLWRVVLGGTRALLVFLRAIPEYIWAFLLIGMLGPSAWPAVLALAIHNTGILGKLDAETVENLSPAAMRALRSAGATRRQIAFHAALPAGLGRFLLYFFYRWETCVREATVLGMLGIVSLGRVINDAWIRDRADEMLFFVLLGSALVLVGDLVSAVARSLVRRAA